jgi:hypothetical protein
VLDERGVFDERKAGAGVLHLVCCAVRPGHLITATAMMLSVLHMQQEDPFRQHATRQGCLCSMANAAHKLLC